MNHSTIIPYSVYRHSQSSQAAVLQVLAEGRTAGGGAYGEKSEEILSKIQEGSPTLLTSSCTHATEMAALLFDVGLGDEVIIPSFGFVSLGTAFAMRGARIVFADSSLGSGSSGLEEIQKVFTSRTKVICVVNYGGGGYEAEQIRSWADLNGVWFLEDNAHGLGGTLNGTRLGSFGHISVTSFHQTKNVSCGEGGAITFNDPSFIERAEILREKGTDRRQFAEGKIDKYVWQDLGSSWVLSEIQCAVLHSELTSLDSLLLERRRIWARYDLALRSATQMFGWLAPQLGRIEEHTAHLYWFVLRSGKERMAFIEHCHSRGVTAVPHYQALHQSPAATKLNAIVPEGMRNAKILSDRLVRIPIFKGMSDDEVDRVVDAVVTFIGREGKKLLLEFPNIESRPIQGPRY